MILGGCMNRWQAGKAAGAKSCAMLKEGDSGHFAQEFFEFKK